MIAVWIILGILVLILLFVWMTYNGLVRLNERVNEAWSDITVQLKYRADLIPNIVESVKGYAKHEREAFESVTKARTSIMSANSVKDCAAAETALEQGLGRIFAIS
jgi:LemA protein